MALYNTQNVRLLVPVLDSNDLVAIGVNTLPHEADDLLELLAAEAAPLSIWFDFAKAYLAQGREDAFKHICLEGIKEEVTQEVTRYFGQPPTYEQIQFHCALAALHIGKGREEKDGALKAEHFAHASKSIQAARLLNPDEQMVSIAQGLLHLTKNEAPQARQEFTKACSQLNNGKTNVIGLLALALMLYQQKQYKDALLLYRRALASNPACPAEVRLGIAACQFRLGDLAAAGAAFERVLALDPNNPEALMGLAVIKFGASNVQQGLADGLRLLARAYEVDPGNVGTLLLLAHFCLLRGEYPKVATLARAAVEGTEHPGVKSQAHCLIARALHAQGQFQGAAQQYTAAAQLDNTSALPHLGLAQLFVRQGAALNATTELELALKAAPNLIDALKVLGQLIADDVTKVSKALGLMKAAVSAAQEDPSVWELMAELSAVAGDHAGALTAYKKALAIYKDRQAHAAERKAAKAEEQQAAGLPATDDSLDENAVIPPRLLNNAAVLCYRGGELQQAAALLHEAQQAIALPGHGQDLTAVHRTALAYNIARLQEASGLKREAEEGYKAILSQEPGYMDCLLRLSCLARSRGATQQALEWVRKAIAQQAGHADALSLLSQLYMDRHDWAQADVYIKQLTAKSHEGGREQDGPAADPFAHLAYGNLLLNSAPSDRKHEEDARRAENSLFKGLEAFRAVLKAQPSNAFAANGIGAVLAELGRLDEAAEVFNEVQAAVAASGGFLHIPDVYINLANVALAKQEYVSAQRLYKIAMDKLGDTKKSQVLLYLARAYYDSDDLPSARNCLMKAIHIAPTDHKLRFNAALTMQEHAVRTLRKKRPPGDPTTLTDYERARTDLANAQNYFDHLQRLGPARTRLNDNHLKAHVSFCNSHRQKAEQMCEVARREAEVLAEQRREVELKRLRESQARDMEALRQEAEERAAQEKREAAARAAMEKQERIKAQWNAQRVEAEEAEGNQAGQAGKKKGKGKKGGKGGARAMAADEEEGSEEGADRPAGEGAGGKQPGSKPSSTAAAATAGGTKEDQDLFGSDSDEEENARVEKELMAQAGLEDDDDDDVDTQPAKKPRRGGAIQDSDDEAADMVPETQL